MSRTLSLSASLLFCCCCRRRRRRPCPASSAAPLLRCFSGLSASVRQLCRAAQRTSGGQVAHQLPHPRRRALTACRRCGPGQAGRTSSACSGPARCALVAGSRTGACLRKRGHVTLREEEVNHPGAGLAAAEGGKMGAAAHRPCPSAGSSRDQQPSSWRSLAGRSGLARFYAVVVLLGRCCTARFSVI